jgi:hypothetical protein
MSGRNILTIWLAVAACVMLPVSLPGCFAQGPAGQGGGKIIPSEPVPASGTLSAKKQNLVIELKRRNWENHGTDVTIDKNGKYVVTAVFLGKTKKVREGNLTPTQMEDLRKFVKDADFFALPDEYKAPFKTSTSWWGYQLRIQINHDSKSVRFHSEDEQVPDSLKSLVQKIMAFTK